MTQMSVMQVLKKSKDWKSAREIAEKLGITPGSVAGALIKMLKYNEVIKRNVKIHGDSGYWVSQWKMVK